MDEQIKQIAERLRGLRDVLELTAEDIARECDISPYDYRLAETGDFDISVSMLQKIARRYGVSLDALMFGEEPKMSSYFLTRAGKGVSIERTKAYKYQALASGFMNRSVDPFIVTVEPKPDDEPIQPVLQFKIAAWHESTGWKNGTIPGNYHVTTKWRMKGISHS